MRKRRSISTRLREAFGDPIGSYAGSAPVGVRDSRAQPCAGCGESEGPCTCPSSGVCPHCGQMPIGGSCGCDAMNEGTEICDECGMMEVEGTCGCTHLEEGRRGGPSKKTARKILRGAKTFKQKMKRVQSWADEPAAAAAWMTKRATGHWPYK